MGESYITPFTERPTHKSQTAVGIGSVLIPLMELS
jgi:hypothetical protein